MADNKTKDKSTKNTPRGRASPWPAEAKIKLLVNENPKRKGSTSYAKFAKYKDGMTVGDARKAGITTPELHWDIEHEYIKIAA